MNRLLHLRTISHEIPSFTRLLAEYGFESANIRHLRAQALRQRAVILIEAHIDQRALYDWRHELESHLQAGGTIVFNGHLAWPLFEEVGLFQVAQGRGMEDLIVERAADHPIFAGVSCDDLSFRRGVAGFYARGANPPPPGAQVLHRLKKDGSPIDWVWQRPQGGTLFMHSGNNMWMYHNDPTSAARLAPQLAEWMLAQAAAIAK